MLTIRQWWRKLLLVSRGNFMNKEEGKFGLFTTISMICGVVIGSGIFFKTDDILIATQGNVLMGILLWVMGAFGIVFGGLCISQYARKSSEAGGLITYCEIAWGKTFAYLAGWFQTIFYFPAIIAVLSWIAAIYIGLIFGITDSSSWQIWLIMASILVILFTLNILSTKRAGALQNITLMIKLAALIGLSLIGLFFGSVENLTSAPIVNAPPSPGLFAGLVACAFAFDGWFVGPAIAHEIRNPKKNLSKALVLSPLIILLVYLLYFVGISAMLGPELIMTLQDGSVGYIVQNLMGEFGVRLVYLAVAISVLGSINGLILGYIRLPFSLAIRDEFPMADYFKRINLKSGISNLSATFAFIMVCFWSLLHFMSVMDVQVGIIQFSGLKIDSLPIVLTYIFYASLYFKIIYNYSKNKDNSFIEGIIFPSLALIGAGFVLFGGMSDPQALVYFFISFIGIGAGLLIRPKKRQTIK